ncbi:MAG: DUF5668 domain-containing protein [Chloroflexota bacterium]
MSENREGNQERMHGMGRWHRRHNPGLFWGLLLILLGAVFFLSQQGIIPQNDWWKYFLIGLGVIFLIRTSYIAGLVLIVVGAAFLVGLSQWWPLILIMLGIIILLQSWWRRR